MVLKPSSSPEPGRARLRWAGFGAGWDKPGEQAATNLSSHRPPRAPPTPPAPQAPGRPRTPALTPPLSERTEWVRPQDHQTLSAVPSPVPADPTRNRGAARPRRPGEPQRPRTPSPGRRCAPRSRTPLRRAPRRHAREDVHGAHVQSRLSRTALARRLPQCSEEGGAKRDCREASLPGSGVGGGGRTRERTS